MEEIYSHYNQTLILHIEFLSLAIMYEKFFLFANLLATNSPAKMHLQMC